MYHKILYITSRIRIYHLHASCGVFEGRCAVMDISYYQRQHFRYILPFIRKYLILHGDVIKWKHFPRYWPFVQGNHWSPVNSPHKGEWSGAFDVFFDMHLNKRLSKQSWGWWFQMNSRPLWRHCDEAQNDFPSATRHHVSCVFRRWRLQLESCVSLRWLGRNFFYLAWVPNSYGWPLDMPGNLQHERQLWCCHIRWNWKLVPFPPRGWWRDLSCNKCCTRNDALGQEPRWPIMPQRKTTRINSMARRPNY